MTTYPGNLNSLLYRVFCGSAGYAAFTSAVSGTHVLLYEHDLTFPLRLPVSSFIRLIALDSCSVYTVDDVQCADGVFVYRPQDWRKGSLIVKPKVTRPIRDIFRDWLLEPMPEVVLLRTDQSEDSGLKSDDASPQNLPLNTFGCFYLGVDQEGSPPRRYPCLSSWLVCEEGMPRYRFLLTMNKLLNVNTGLNSLVKWKTPRFTKSAILFRENDRFTLCFADTSKDLSSMSTDIARMQYLYADYLVVLSSLIGYTRLTPSELLLLLHGPVAYGITAYLPYMKWDVVRKSSLILTSYLLGSMEQSELQMLEPLLGAWKSFRCAFGSDGMKIGDIYLPNIDPARSPDSPSMCDTGSLYSTCKLMYSQIGKQLDLEEV